MPQSKCGKRRLYKNAAIIELGIIITGFFKKSIEKFIVKANIVIKIIRYHESIHNNHLKKIITRTSVLFQEQIFVKGAKHKLVHIEFAKDKSDCHIVFDAQPCIGGSSLIIAWTVQSLPIGQVKVTGTADAIAQLDFYQPESIDLLIEKLNLAKKMLLTHK